VALPIILAIAQPETFAFGILGLSLVASLAGSSIYKGLAAGAFGLLLSAVGYAEASAIPRYNFGTDYLLDNLPFLPLILGLFAIPELMELATSKTSISRVQEDQSKSTMWQGVKDTWTHIGLNIRCCIIGVYIGILPGLGGSVADWLAYGHAKQSAKDKSQFGKGDIRGVIGPESCNNAVLGGSLIPTVAFGIPGGAGMAILLGAFLIQGLRPGPEMLTTKLDITFSMVWTVAIANIIVAIMMMAWARQVAKLAFTPGYYIVPGVILFVFMGAWMSTTSVGDWVLCIAFVLGEIMENAYVISIRAYDGYSWLLRPVTLLIFAGAVLTIALSARGILKMKRAGEVMEEGAEEGSMRNSVLSVPFAVLLSATFLYAIAGAFEWTKSVRMFPLTIAIPGAIFALIALFYDWRGLRGDIAQAGGLKAAARAASAKADLIPSLWFFAMLIALLIVMLLIGMKLAIPLYVLVFLMTWGKVKWTPALIYAGVCYAFLVGFYDQVLHTSWHPSLLYDLLVGNLPAWLPEWLIL